MSHVNKQPRQSADSLFELLLHLVELLLGHGALALSQLLQLLPGGVKVGPRRRRRDLTSEVELSGTHADQRLTS